MRAGFSPGEARQSPAESLFLQGALRVYDALRLRTPGDPTTEISLYAQPLGVMGGIAFQITFLASCICLAALMAISIHGLRAVKKSGAAFLRATAFVSLLIWLICWWDVNRGDGRPTWFLCSVDFNPVATYISLVATAAGGYMAARRPVMAWISLLIYSSFFILHFAFWFVTVADRAILPLALLSVAAAAKGGLWLSAKRESLENLVGLGSPVVERKIRLLLGSISLATLFLIWSPFPRITHVAALSQLNSLGIQLSRGGPAAPTYSISIHGDGLAEYVGERSVAITGARTTRIQPFEVQRVAQLLDRIDFFQLDGRTFTACPDMSWAKVTLSAGHRKKSVIAIDCHSPLFETARQRELLNIAQEIDGIAGSDHWTRCDGPCLR